MNVYNHANLDPRIRTIPIVEVLVRMSEFLLYLPNVQTVARRVYMPSDPLHSRATKTVTKL